MYYSFLVIYSQQVRVISIIIKAIYKCIITDNKINKLFSNSQDIPKFTSSIREFLAGYNDLKNKSEEDNEFIKILTAINVFRPF